MVLDFRSFHIEEAPFKPRPVKSGPSKALFLGVLGFKEGDVLWPFRERFTKITDAELNDSKNQTGGER